MMNILRVDVDLEDDELRIRQSLLANTTLQVRLEEVLSNPFKTTTGTPQGDLRNKIPPKPIEEKISLAKLSSLMIQIL